MAELSDVDLTRIVHESCNGAIPRSEEVRALVAEVRRLRAELSDASRLAIGSRLVLDRCAEGQDAPGEAAGQAQRIVNIYGHAVTDEPPHTVVALRAAEAERDRLRSGIEQAAEILHRSADDPKRRMIISGMVEGHLRGLLDDSTDIVIDTLP